MKGYYRQLYVNTLRNTDEMKKLLQRLKLLKLTREEMDMLKRTVMTPRINLGKMNKEKIPQTIHKEKLRPRWLHC